MPPFITAIIRFFAPKLIAVILRYHFEEEPMECLLRLLKALGPCRGRSVEWEGKRTLRITCELSEKKIAKLKKRDVEGVKLLSCEEVCLRNP